MSYGKNRRLETATYLGSRENNNLAVTFPGATRLFVTDASSTLLCLPSYQLCYCTLFIFSNGAEGSTVDRELTTIEIYTSR